MISAVAFRFFAIVLIAAWMLGKPGVQAGNSDPFRAVPVQDRSLLKEKIEQMVNLQREQPWAEIYELLPKSHQNKPRQDFVKEASHGSRLVSFVPREATVSPTDQNKWLILGCGTFIRRNVTEHLESVILARRAEWKWSLFPVLVVTPEAGHPRTCN